MAKIQKLLFVLVLFAVLHVSIQAPGGGGWRNSQWPGQAVRASTPPMPAPRNYPTPAPRYNPTPVPRAIRNQPRRGDDRQRQKEINYQYQGSAPGCGEHNLNCGIKW